MTEEPQSTSAGPFQASERAPIEVREAAVVDSVDFSQRIVRLVAVPYEEPTTVMYRGEMWKEVFERSAFNGLEKRPNRVRANRDHDKSRTVGKALRFWPGDAAGLISEVRVAQTPLGDETLALASEDMLSVSIGFGVLPKDQRLDKRTMTRRIHTAYLDHISFVESPAYEGAQVLGVRSNTAKSPEALLPKLATPELDRYVNDDVMLWAAERLGK